MSKEEEIQKNMKLLGITRKEAEELYADDRSNEDLPEVKELTAKAKQVKRRYETSGNKRKPQKEKPPDDVKINFIQNLIDLIQAFEGVESAEIFNPSQEITFMLQDDLFSLKLIRHTKKTWEKFNR